MLYQLEDAKSERIVFVGTYEACMEYSKQNPDVKYNMTEVKR